MFVIKNKNKPYACYLSENNKWEGLLKAKTFKTKEEIKEFPEDGEVISWEEVVSVKK